MVYEMAVQLLSDALVCDPEGIGMNSRLREELELSSSDLQEILSAMAEEFSFSWRPHDLEDLNTVQDLVSYIEDRI